MKINNTTAELDPQSDLQADVKNVAVTIYAPVEPSREEKIEPQEQRLLDEKSF